MLRLAIIGVGLIGGSFGLALKSRLNDQIHIRGLCRSQASMNEAVMRGALDEASHSLEFVVKDADIIYLSTPVLQMIPIVEQMLPFIKPGAIITDAASTKKYLLENLRKIIPKNIYYISGHPMAGKEKSGISAADKDLFVNKCYVIIKEPDAPEEIFEKFSSLIKVTGANLTTLSAKQHDRCASIISHVPHVAASALVTLLERNSGDLDACLKLAGGGFKDTTRIASSNADMWADILMTNGEEITKNLMELREIFDDVIALIKANDRQKLYDYFAAAKKQRDQILDTTEKLFDI